MTADTEALRAQFERRMNLRGWSEAIRAGAKEHGE